MVEITLKFLMDLQEFLKVLVTLITKLSNTEEVRTLYGIASDIGEGASAIINGVGAFFSGIFN